MSIVRIALANIRVPGTPEESVRLATSAVAEAGSKGASCCLLPRVLRSGISLAGERAATA